MDYSIQTERLFLRPLNENDTAFLQDLLARPASFRYETAAAPSREDLAKNCEWYREQMQSLPREGAIRWIVLHENEPVGQVHLNCNWEETAEWEIGWHLLPEHWGNGYAAEAAKAAARYAFANLRVHRIAAFINADNTRSAALAERIGMIREGRMREVRYIGGVRHDELVYSLLARESHNLS